MSQTYLNFKELDNGNLEITATPEGIEYLQDNRAIDSTDEVFWKRDQAYILWELMESYLTNGSYCPTDSSEVSGLTDASMILSCKDTDDDGNVIIHPDTKLWWFPDYMVIDPLEKLMNGASVIFTLAITDEEPTLPVDMLFDTENLPVEIPGFDFALTQYIDTDTSDESPNHIGQVSTINVIKHIHTDGLISYPIHATVNFRDYQEIYTVPAVSPVAQAYLAYLECALWSSEPEEKNENEKTAPDVDAEAKKEDKEPVTDTEEKEGEENELEKGGEGSKGGKIIGHTKSGKAIYENHNHESHKKFTSEDHMDASDAHMSSEKSTLDNNHKDEASAHHYRQTDEYKADLAERKKKGGKMEKSEALSILESISKGEQTDSIDPKKEKNENENWNVHNISLHTQNKFITNVVTFMRKCAKELRELLNDGTIADYSQIGHTLWLSQQGHGSGWFDFSMDKGIEDKLTRESQALGEGNLFVDDNNQISYE